MSNRLAASEVKVSPESYPRLDHEKAKKFLLIKNYKGDFLRVAQYTRHRSLEMLQIYNGNIKMEADVPNYYRTFSGVKIQGTVIYFWTN